MGIVPHWDPFDDAKLVWAIVRVERVRPRDATWARLATVRLRACEALRGDVPTRMDVVFGRPRDAGQAYFHVERDLFPPANAEAAAELTRRRAELDATPVDVPEVGETIVVWLTVESPARFWRPAMCTIAPMLAYGGTPIPMRTRWIPASDEAIAHVRARLAR